MYGRNPQDLNLFFNNLEKNRKKGKISEEEYQERLVYLESVRKEIISENLEIDRKLTHGTDEEKEELVNKMIERNIMQKNKENEQQVEKIRSRGILYTILIFSGGVFIFALSRNSIGIIGMIIAILISFMVYSDTQKL